MLSAEVFLFLPENSQSKETEDFETKKEFYLYVNRQTMILLTKVTPTCTYLQKR